MPTEAQAGDRNPINVAGYQALLEAKREQLERALRHRDGIVIQKTPDLLEETQLAVERELTIRNLNRESSLLRDVKAALQRIAEGSYGVCLHCEEEINRKRLDAVPWTAYCVRCQEAADRQELDSREDDGFRTLTEAA